MQALLDFLDDYIYGPLNYLDRAEGLFKAMIYQDAGHRFAIPRIDKGGNYNLRQVEDLLHRYGVPVYSRTYDAKYRYFRVKKRQASWAEYLMLHAGIELCSPLFDERNARYVSRHPAGWMPRPWAEQKQEDPESSQSLSTVNEDETDENTKWDDWNVFKKLVDW